MKNDKKVILKVLVGSRAHGLHSEDSDYDYRSVYVLPTSDILSIGYKYKGNDWLEGETEDNTSYEIGHFLSLAVQCNPTILEIFRAPVITSNQDGDNLRDLFPCIWSPKKCFDAFVGYGLNQRKKFLDRKDNRQNKYAVAYIRVLWQLIKLLKTNELSVAIDNIDIKELLLRWKHGDYTMGDVINCSETAIEEAKKLLEDCKHVPDLTKVNQFLVSIRKQYWE
jgi:hypothetical protein